MHLPLLFLTFLPLPVLSSAVTTTCPAAAKAMVWIYELNNCNTHPDLGIPNAPVPCQCTAHSITEGVCTPLSVDGGSFYSFYGISLSPAKEGLHNYRLRGRLMRYSLEGVHDTVLEWSKGRLCADPWTDAVAMAVRSLAEHRDGK